LIFRDRDTLPNWLQTRRWFGGKGAQIASVRTLDVAELSEGLHALALEVTYSGGRLPETYLLLVKPTRDGTLEEGLLDDGGARAVLDAIRNRRVLKTEAGELRGERFDAPGSPMDELEPEPSVRRLTAEQSNTSIVFGEKVIVKLIRKIERGVNPELELGAHLARNGFARTPPLLGALSLSGALEGTVAVAHRFVQVDSDGWAWLLAELRKSATPRQELLAEIEELGVRVGELHVALAAGTDPAFTPEPLTSSDLQRWTNSLLADLEKTIAAAQAAVPELAARAIKLKVRIERLAAHPPSGVRIRQHGDLHLGQVLRSNGQWLIFDFEGEPARSYAERRSKSSPLKDVAGMLRSFAYAAATIEQEGGQPADRVGPLREAFLRGHQRAAAALLPEPQMGHALLTALELEKLLYELRYEIGHRPDWVRIPARDLLALEAP